MFGFIKEWIEDIKWFFESKIWKRRYKKMLNDFKSQNNILEATLIVKKLYTNEIVLLKPLEFRFKDVTLSNKEKLSAHNTKFNFYIEGFSMSELCFDLETHLASLYEDYVISDEPMSLDAQELGKRLKEHIKYIKSKD